MDRYRVPTGVESEFEPGSHGAVLRNKLAIKSEPEMEVAEAKALVRVQLGYLSNAAISADTRFTAALILKMHGDWLDGIYEWAGKYRTVELAKDGFPFPPAHLIATNMATLEAELLRPLTPFRPGQVRAVCIGVAQIHADLLLIHPFREGNGRTARWLADLMFLQADLPLPNYEFVGKGGKQHRSTYLNAVRSGYVRDYQPLADFFARALSVS